MPKPISQRGFEISKGEYDRYYISYSIDREGLEDISVRRGNGGFVSITADDGDIKNISFDADCKCHFALQYAIVTDKRLIPAKIKKALKPIIGKYVQ